MTKALPSTPRARKVTAAAPASFPWPEDRIKYGLAKLDELAAEPSPKEAATDVEAAVARVKAYSHVYDQM